MLSFPVINFEHFNIFGITYLHFYTKDVLLYAPNHKLSAPKFSIPGTSWLAIIRLLRSFCCEVWPL